jgi:hypothetical protein
MNTRSTPFDARVRGENAALRMEAMGAKTGIETGLSNVI